MNPYTFKNERTSKGQPNFKSKMRDFCEGEAG